MIPLPSGPLSRTDAGYEQRLRDAAKPRFAGEEPAFFPGPVFTRQIAAAGATGLLAPLPRARVFPIVLSTLAGTRTSIALGPLAKVVIVRDVVYDNFVFSDPYISTFELGKAPSKIAEQSVPLATPRPYQVLTELQDPAAFGNPNAGAGYPIDTVPTTHVVYSRKPGLILTDPQNYFVVALISSGVTNMGAIGYVHLLENVPEDQVAAWYGGM